MARLEIRKKKNFSLTHTRAKNGKQQLAPVLDAMADRPTTEILDGLRELERKTSLVFTLLKASVYSIVLQQEINWGDPQAAGGGGGGTGWRVWRRRAWASAEGRATTPCSWS